VYRQKAGGEQIDPTDGGVSVCTMMEIYINGQLKASKRVFAFAVPTICSNVVSVHKSIGSGASHRPVLCSDLSFFEKALSAQEIQELSSLKAFSITAQRRQRLERYALHLVDVLVRASSQPSLRSKASHSNTLAVMLRLYLVVGPDGRSAVIRFFQRVLPVSLPFTPGFGTS